MAADPAQLCESRRQVRDFLATHSVEPQTADDVVLCVHEACANAIEHSHTGEAIDIQLHLLGERLSVVVADGGCGLELGSHGPHGRPELHAPRGRGLYLMASLMDEFAVHRNSGTEIRMAKWLTSSQLVREDPGLRRAS
jgi:anti-sigma regulatory factor (Ser/Thr protein kinase)